MQLSLVRVFDVFEQAERALVALLAAGFDADALVLRIVNDEAGPLAGNFTVGKMPVESNRHTYAPIYAGSVSAVQCIFCLQLREYLHRAVAPENPMPQT